MVAITRTYPLIRAAFVYRMPHSCISVKNDISQRIARPSYYLLTCLASFPLHSLSFFAIFLFFYYIFSMYYTIYVSFYQRVTTVDEEDAGHDDAGHRRRRRRDRWRLERSPKSAVTRASPTSSLGPATAPRVYYHILSHAVPYDISCITRVIPLCHRIILGEPYLMT
jgi:hypothetical protein